MDRKTPVLVYLKELKRVLTRIDVIENVGATRGLGGHPHECGRRVKWLAVELH